MPLDRSCSDEAFGNNVEAELRAGKPRRQAVATATSVAEDCKAEDDPKTPADPDEQRRGSGRNPAGSAGGSRGGIKIDDATEQALRNKVDEHNEAVGQDPAKRVDIGKLKAVYRRGAGAFSTSHRPSQNRASWSMARVNAFLYLMRNGKPQRAAYVTDNDLLPEEHPKSTKKSLPTPAEAYAVMKGRPARSREYLEEVMAAAKEVLPPWMFAVIHKLAFPRAGGRGRSRRRKLQAAARLAAGERVEADELELEVAKSEIERLTSTLKQDSFTPPQDVRDAAQRALDVREEKPDSQRGMTPVGLARARDLANGRPVSMETIRRMVSFFARHEGDKQGESWGDKGKGWQAWHGWGGDPGRRWAERIVREHDEKGLTFPHPDAGAHAHGIDYDSGQTHLDGDHCHAFMMPGTGEVFHTYEDGCHVHTLDGGGGPMGGGEHTHQVRLPDGRMAQTQIGGAHPHEELTGTSGFGGAHTHRLLLPDGTTLTSLTVREYNEHYHMDGPGNPMPPASELQSALINVSRLRDEVEALRSVPEVDIDEVIEQLAEGREPPRLTYAVEVVGKAFDGVEVALADADTGILAECAEGLDLEEGDVVEYDSGAVVSRSARLMPMTAAEALKVHKSRRLVEKAARRVEWTGPDLAARAVFVAAAPNELESARGEPIVGPDAKVFEERYLAPLGIGRSDAAVGFVAPHWMPDPVDVSKMAPWLDQLNSVLERHPGAKVVALGKTAKEALGDGADVWVPHPAVVRKSGDFSQVDRKMKRVRLAERPPIAENKGDGERAAQVLADAEAGSVQRVVLKADRAEEQIVYGIVLDPNGIDAHNDWAPPAEIQKTAHNYLSKSRVVGLEHQARTRAEVVESFVEQYPSESDYEAAMQMRPHRVTRRRFGTDFVHSGAWVLGVKLEDEEWAAYKQGKITGFSMGGFSVKTDIAQDDLPAITVVDLVEAP